MSQINLPQVIQDTSNYLTDITTSLNVPRSILASDEEIKEAWERLPNLISKIPNELISKGIVKMCIAVSSGLFDSGINYIWNESVIELRNKVKRFGLGIVGEVIEKRDFDEQKLNDLQDSELLSLSLKLNLITEEGFFYLDQCRDIRNNFSAAHPTIGELDQHELLNFTNRCIKYALSNDQILIGVNFSEFISSIKSSKFENEQLKIWKEKIISTHEAQRELLFGKMYGIYCDKDSSEEARVNSLNLCLELSEYITPVVRSNFISSYQGYILKQDNKAKNASQTFFEKLGLLTLLGSSELHTIIKNACKNLFDAHLGINNFYNEPPFAERLYEITNGIAVPDSIKFEFVEVVIACGIGNIYGVSNRAFPIYEKIVSNFSPKEIEIMFKMVEDDKTYVGQRLRNGVKRKQFLKLLIKNIDESSVSTTLKIIYNKWNS